MKLVKCPLCNGAGTISVKIRKGLFKRVIGSVECPVCGGDKSVYIIDENDVVTVEMASNDYVRIHKRGAFTSIRVEHNDMKVTEAEARYPDITFCSACFGRTVIYKDRLYTTY